MMTNERGLSQIHRLGCAAIVALCIGASGPARAATTPQVPKDAVATAQALNDAYATIVEHTKGAVVSVLSEKVMKLKPGTLPFPFDDPFLRRFFGGPGGGSENGLGPHNGGKVPVAGLGSGFVLDEQGHVLTNYHVVEGMETIHVVFPNKQSYKAKVLGSDPNTDIAVLKLEGQLPKDLVTARLGDSDKLKAGHLVLAFGAPFGLTQTVTNGIISATGRSNVGIADFEDFLQTDAPINPGNSGGPLVNMQGEVVGIDTAIATSVGQSAGVGFAIPINMVKEVLPTLLQGKKVVRGMLGIGVQNITPSLAKQFNLKNTEGALVSQVNPGSPAAHAGLKPGDVVVGFGGKPITDSSQLREMVARNAPGSLQNLTVLRNGQPLTLTAKLGELQPQKPEEVAQQEKPQTSGSLAKFGVEAQNLTPEAKSEFNVKAKQGVVVTDVDPASPAGLAGLQPGDVISEVDRKKVDSVKSADQVLAQAKDKNQVLLLVNHQGLSAYVTLETG